jgi:hypothetical protein
MYEESPWEGIGPGTGAKIAFGFTAGLAVVSAVLGVFSAVDGDVLGAAGFGAGAVFLGHLVGFCTHLWWRPRRSAPAVALNGQSVTFHYSWWTYYWTGSVTILMALALLLVGSSGLLAGGAGIVLTVSAFAGAGFLGWQVVRLAVGGRGGLRLTPTMLEHHGLGFTHRLPWESVTDVLAAEVNEAPLIVLTPSPSAPVNVSFAWTARAGGKKGLLLPSMAIRGVWLADDPVIVYQTLRHYHANPAHRMELSTEAATDRIRRRRFLAG